MAVFVVVVVVERRVGGVETHTHSIILGRRRRRRRQCYGDASRLIAGNNFKGLSTAADSNGSSNIHFDSFADQFIRP